MKLININHNNRYGAGELLKDVEEINDLDLLVCIYKKKDGAFGIGATHGNNAEIIGLIELGKLQYMDNLNEP